MPWGKYSKWETNLKPLQLKQTLQCRYLLIYKQTKRHGVRNGNFKIIFYFKKGAFFTVGHCFWQVWLKFRNLKLNFSEVSSFSKFYLESIKFSAFNTWRQSFLPSSVLFGLFRRSRLLKSWRDVWHRGSICSSHLEVPGSNPANKKALSVVDKTNSNS